MVRMITQQRAEFFSGPVPLAFGRGPRRTSRKSPRIGHGHPHHKAPGIGDIVARLGIPLKGGNPLPNHVPHGSVLGSAGQRTEIHKKLTGQFLRLPQHLSALLREAVFRLNAFPEPARS